jgi:ribosomal protein S18 acetylase RimI-like enzyme
MVAGHVGRHEGTGIASRGAIRLRPARPADQAFLLALRRQTMTEHLSRVGLDLSEERHLQRLLANYDDAHVICVGDEDAGLLKAYRTDTQWVLMQIQIAPAWQGRGIGAEVIETLIARAHEHGLPVTLSVLKGNPARRLYERLGFNVVAEGEHEFELCCDARSAAL